MIPFTACVCQDSEEWILSEESRRCGVSLTRTDDNHLLVRMPGDACVKSDMSKKERRHSCITDAEYRLLQFLDTGELTRIRLPLKFSTLQKTRRRRPRQRCTYENASLLDEIYTGQIKCLLSTVGRWNFNIFTLDKLTNGRPLFSLTLHLFKYYDLIHRFHLDSIKLMRCISQIEDSYHGNNPYHHAVHAADVTQAMHCYLRETLFSACITPLEIMTAVLAAAAHDIDHPGVNQGFLIATKNHLADLYQNRSVLENHHWRVAVGIIQQSGLFQHLPEQTWREIESDLKSLILATDITRQQEFLIKFKKLIDNNDLDLAGNKLHRHFILQIALKCADICNVSRPWELSKKWSNYVCKEFFQQGDYERKLGLSVTPNCDRNLTSVAKIQTGFIQFVVSPLFQEWYRFLPTRLGKTMLKTMQKNRESWEKVLKDAAAELDQEKENNHDEPRGGNGLVKSPRVSLESIASLAHSITSLTSETNFLETETIAETHYEVETEDDTLDVPIRLQLRRHSLPPNISKKDAPATFLVRRQSVPYTGTIKPLPKLCERSVSQGTRSSWDSIQQKSRITSLSGVDMARVNATSPVPNEKYLGTRRASFPLQKTISKTTFTSTRTKSSREPLSQLNYRRRTLHENLVNTVRSDRLNQKRFSDPGMQIPTYLIKSLENRLSAAPSESSSHEDLEECPAMRLPLRRFSLEGREEVSFYERTSGK